ncbi:hypothetical protein QN224_13535 [Sinorhizobium sp. 8-89]|uniref:hypothetical protein n=1 Tax=Sinorhizobium sp. 7-81 TaxID=3049087 RepID=UPI0024C45F3F|nr:hypothetical protein [Sinorhizobium sp. 7-81]MDK1386429.1 hypothetical protein [Sinorhizobium sp. 7-81]
MFSITKARAFLLTAAAILLSWYAASAVLFAVREEGKAAIVLLPAHGLSPNGLPPGVSILKWGRYFAVLASDKAGYVPALYAAGALIVLPSRAGGCLSLRPPAAR